MVQVRMCSTAEWIQPARNLETSKSTELNRGSIVVPFGGSYIECYKVLPKRNHYEASG